MEHVGVVSAAACDRFQELKKKKTSRGKIGQQKKKKKPSGLVITNNVKLTQENNQGKHGILKNKGIAIAANLQCF